jgi:hypothetical protein
MVFPHLFDRGAKQEFQVNQELIEKVSKKIYRRFPAVKGAKPRVQTRRPEGSYTLAYHSVVTTSNRKSLPYWVRVVVDESGKILKITTSR